MSAEDVKKQLEFERSLKVGDECVACWTNCGHYYRGEVEVENLNDKSFRVKLLQSVDGYPAGQSLNIPNFLNTDRWSWCNRLTPKRELRVCQIALEGVRLKAVLNVELDSDMVVEAQNEGYSLEEIMEKAEKELSSSIKTYDWRFIRDVEVDQLVRKEGTANVGSETGD